MRRSSVQFRLLAPMTEQVEAERKELIEAISWIDIRRKAIRRLSFEQTWMPGNRRYQIAMLKKEEQWLFNQRERLRQRLAAVNNTIRESRIARNGRPDVGFGSVFVEVARERLSKEVFDELMRETSERYGDQRSAPYASAGGEKQAVLQTLQEELEKFRQSNPPPRPVVPRQQIRIPVPSRESQSDFGITHGRPVSHDRIFAERGA